jgi:hypothetical protein
VTKPRPLALNYRPVAFTACKYALSFGEPFLAAIIEQGGHAVVHRSSSFVSNCGALVASFEQGHRATLRSCR